MNDQAAERALLGSLLLGSDVAFSPDDFFYEPHRTVASAIRSLRLRGEPTDAVTVRAELGVSGAMLLDVIDSVPTAANAAHYASIVSELARRRRIHAAAEHLRVACETGDGYDQKAAEVLDAAAHGEKRAERLGDALSRIIPTLTSKREYVWLADYPSVHLHFGDFCIVAARPGVGKSAWAGQLADEWAGRGLKTRLYSLEMGVDDWTLRAVQRHTPFTSDDLDDGLTPEKAELVERSMAELLSLPLTIVDNCRYGVADFMADVRSFARRGGKVVILDYLQLLVSKGDYGSRYEAVTEVSRALKVLARETNVLLIALSQLNRGSAKDDGTLRPPSMAELRESGALEQDADDIILIHRYADTDPIKDELRQRRYILEHELPVAHLDFAKLRRGRVGRVYVWWDGGDQRFFRMDREV